MAEMYDEFSAYYDEFVNWDGRLSVELPFIEQLLGSLREGKNGALHILDAACGTGMHAIALAGKGYQASGADMSSGMIDQARHNSVRAGAQVRFEHAGFGELTAVFGEAAFDAILCLGNSLPHLLTEQELTSALGDFSASLRADGLLLIQNRNFDSVLQVQNRWMEPQSNHSAERETLFIRFYDFEPDGLITFNIITLLREGSGSWKQFVTVTKLRPLQQSELIKALMESGFSSISCYGNLAGDPFNESSPNLVLAARKTC